MARFLLIFQKNKIMQDFARSLVTNKILHGHARFCKIRITGQIRRVDEKNSSDLEESETDMSNSSNLGESTSEENETSADSREDDEKSKSSKTSVKKAKLLQ